MGISRHISMCQFKGYTANRSMKAFPQWFLKHLKGHCITTWTCGSRSTRL